MKNRVLFIMHIPPPIHGASIMGKYIFDSQLINDKFNCQFINLSASNNVDEVGRLSIRKFLFLITNLVEIIKTVLKHKPQLCYITPTSGGWGFYRDYILVKLLKLSGVKILLHFHNKGTDKWSNQKHNFLLLKSFFNKIQIILLSEELYPERKPFIDIKSVYFCANGITSVCDTIQHKTLINESVQFLFLSNMMEEKGVYILLKACFILKNKGYKFHCDFVGGWKDISENEFIDEVIKLSLQNFVTAHGPKFGNEKKYFFEKADVFVFPTFYHGETFGLVLLEAMDFSLPCISTNNGAIKTVIEDKITGFCINQRNTDELANKMIWMIENPEERVKMGKSGKKRFEDKFTLNHFEANIITILNDCINNN